MVAAAAAPTRSSPPSRVPGMSRVLSMSFSAAAKAGPAEEDRADARELEERRGRMRNRLRRIVCSRWWEDELLDGFERGRIPWRDKQDAVERTLDRLELYPPGGLLGSSMVRCTECRHWTPACASGEEFYCFECLPPPPHRTRSAWPVGERYPTPCFSCGQHTRGGMRRVVCLDCHYARLAPAELAKLPSSQRFTWPVADAAIMGVLARVRSIDRRGAVTEVVETEMGLIELLVAEVREEGTEGQSDEGTEGRRGEG